MSSRSTSFAAVILSIYFLVEFLWYSQSILIPFIFAVLVFNLMCTAADYFRNLPYLGRYIPNSLAVCLALLSFLVLTSLFVKILTSNMQEMLNSSASVQASFMQLVNHLSQQGMIMSFLQSTLKSLNIQHMFISFYTAISNFMSSMLLMCLFVIFFFIEKAYFRDKLKAILPDHQRRKQLELLLQTIPARIQYYLGLKTVFSIFTGFAIYLVMRWMGLAFAEFWGALVFLMNFIPNIGPVLVTLVLTSFSYFQTEDWKKALIFLSLQLLIHTLIGNLMETHYLGRSLHLSPLTIILALCFWGMLWGTTGLFLAVPMTVLMMIVFAAFQATRPYAMMMSLSGQLPE